MCRAARSSRSSARMALERRQRWRYMDEAENLADRIAVIAAGRIVAEGTPKTLGGRQRMASTLRFTLPGGFDVGALPDSLRRLVRSDANGRIALESREP